MLQRSMLTRCVGAAGPTGKASPAIASASHSLLVMSLQAHDHGYRVPWPLPGEAPPTASPSSASPFPLSHPTSHASEGAAYVSVPRSPFSVMRAKRTRAGRCAASLLPQQVEVVGAVTEAADAAPCCAEVGAMPWCCCSALVYQSLQGSAPGKSDERLGPVLQSTDTEAKRHEDALVLGLKLNGTEGTLREVIGEAAFAELVGPALVDSHAAPLCADPTALLTRSAAAATSSSLSATHWIARTLLTAEEENRIKWLWEETGDLSRCYSRAPTLRTLFVMWTITKMSMAARGTAAGGTGHAMPHNASLASSSPSAARTPSSPPPQQQQQEQLLMAMPSASDIDQVYQRMADHHVSLTLCDVAAMTYFATIADSPVQNTVAHLVARLISPERVSRMMARRSSAQADFDVILVLTSLCQYVRQMRGAASEQAAAEAAATQAANTAAASDGDSKGRVTGTGTEDTLQAEGGLAAHRELTPAEESRLVSIVRVATRLSDLRARLDEATVVGSSASPTASSAALQEGVRAEGHTVPHADTLRTLIDRFVDDTRALVSACGLPSTSSHIHEVTVWLLREMPSSAACHRHFQAVIDRGPMDAVLMLERSGLLGKRDVDLRTVNRALLPLLEHCGNEDFVAQVMRDVIGLLEDRLRRDPHSFTEEDMRLLAELGTKLFAASSAADGTAMGAAGSFDVAAREQMEELHVMDGSPWALCVSSYRSLKEIVQNLVRDQRKLRRQVQEQMRSISMATGSVLLRGCGITGTHRIDDPCVSAATTGAAPSRNAEGGTAAVPRPPSRTLAGGSQQVSDGNGGVTGNGTTSATAAAAAEAEEEMKSRPRMMASPVVRNRFLVFLEDLVKELVDDSVAESERPIVISSDLFAFINKHVPVPNIQDEYRRKIFLLVNVAEDPETVRQRRRALRRQRRLEEQRHADEYDRQHNGANRRGRAIHIGGSRRRSRLHQRSAAAVAAGEGVHAADVGDDDDGVDVDDADEDGDGADPAGDLHGGAEEIPAELRFLVSSLPLTLSPWASVMILREVLAESAGRNPRYSYVLNAAIDLQLPISTTRSRIATTLNMWRFLNTQAHKLTLKESVVMKQRCVLNLPFSYILSSYWSLLTSLVVAFIIMLNVVGLDFESQLVANSLFQKFTPWEEVVDVDMEPWNAEAAADLASDYFGQDEIGSRHRMTPRRSSDILLSSASYLFLGYDDQRRPMTLIPISSDPGLSEEARSTEEFACAAAVLRELSLHAPFPFYLDMERPMSVEYVEARVAERIRRVSFNNTWFVPRMIIRTFPLDRQYTERMLITHTCSQANLTRRRITFLFYVEDGVPITPQFVRGLQESFLSQSANLVLVVHERSLHKGGATPRAMEKLVAASSPPTNDAGVAEDGGKDRAPLRVLPYCRRLHDVPEGYFRRLSAQITREATKKKRRGREAAAKDLAVLQSFSPFTRHFALHMPLDDDGERGFANEPPEGDDVALPAFFDDAVNMVVGATAATVNVIVDVFRVALRATAGLMGGDGGTSVRSPSTDPHGGVGTPHVTSATRAEDGHSGSDATASSYPRKVVAVPLSLVNEAIKKTKPIGQSAMRWLGDGNGDKAG